MTITRDMLIDRLAAESEFFKKDIKILLQSLDKVVFDTLCEVTDEDEVSIQLVTGVKLQCVPVKERPRKNPQTQQDVICKPTCKIKAKFSQDMKFKLQENYDKKYNQ